MPVGTIMGPNMIKVQNPANLEAFVSQFKEEELVTIFEEKMASIQIDL